MSTFIFMWLWAACGFSGSLATCLAVDGSVQLNDFMVCIVFCILGPIAWMFFVLYGVIGCGYTPYLRRVWKRKAINWDKVLIKLPEPE